MARTILPDIARVGKVVALCGSGVCHAPGEVISHCVGVYRKAISEALFG